MEPRLERAVRSGPACLAVLGLSEEYPLLSATENVHKVLGLSVEELTGDPSLWAQRVHPDDVGRVMRGFADIGTVGAGELTFRFRDASDGYRWIRAAARSGRGQDEGSAELYLSLHEVTERHEYERAMRQQMDALRRSNLELEQFAHIASHDLQEPLRMVASYTRLIADRYGESLDEDGRDFMGFALSGAERMQAMIRDLLTYSRLGQMEPDLRPIELAKVVDTVEAMLRGTIQETGARIERLGPLPAVLGAEAQCLTVLQNLVSNGIKFRRDDSEPVIAIAAEPLDDRWRIAVSDNGIGIEASAHERVFQAFKKLHRPEEYPGTGLGLSLCRRIVEHHGGEIGLESEPGVGTTVWFTLAAATEAANEPGRNDAPARVSTGVLA